MINLKNKDTGEFISTITEAELQFLVDELEEESAEDKDYWLNRAELEIMREKGAEPAFINMLESALGDKNDMEVIWERV